MPSVVEVQRVALPASTNTPVPLATSLVATDVVVVIMYTIFVSAGTVTCPGMTATRILGADQSSRTNSWRHVIVWAHGGVGAKTLTLNPAGSATHAHVYVIRGLNSATKEGQASSTYGQTLSTGKSAFLTAGRNQVAILTAMKEGGGNPTTFPSAPSPASGWVTTLQSGDLFSAYNATLTKSGSVGGGITPFNAGLLGVTVVAFGTPDPDLPSGFRGWGIPI